MGPPSPLAPGGPSLSPCTVRTPGMQMLWLEPERPAWRTVCPQKTEGPHRMSSAPHHNGLATQLWHPWTYG